MRQIGHSLGACELTSGCIGQTYRCPETLAETSRPRESAKPETVAAAASTSRIRRPVRTSDEVLLVCETVPGARALATNPFQNAAKAAKGWLPALVWMQ